jgi:hypothetical protein
MGIWAYVAIIVDGTEKPNTSEFALNKYSQRVKTQGQTIHNLS